MVSLSISSFKYLVAFFVITIFLSLIFILTTEIMIRNHVEPNDLLIRHVELFRSSQSNSAFFGDSHVYSGFIGRKNLLNLGYPSENIEIIHQKVLLYFSDRKPDIVILQADPHMFAEYRHKSAGTYIKPFEVGLDAGGLRVLNPYHRGYILGYWKVLCTKGTFYNRAVFNTCGGSQPGADFSNLPEKRREIQAESKVIRHIPDPDFRQHDFARFYQDTIDTLKERGAKVYLVTMPVGRAYLQGADKHPEFADALEYFKTLGEKTGATYLNFYRFFENDSDDLFANADHLNFMGAGIFTRRILQECLLGK